MSQTTPDKPVMISVVIFTRNAEDDLPECVASLRWCDDVHVFDACSTDGTVEIARRLGTKVTERAYDGYTTHRNAALHSLPFKHSWVLLLEADERVSDVLREEALRFAAAAATDCAAARVARKDIFQGVCLEHASESPTEVRLVRPYLVRYDRGTSDLVRVGGLTADLSAPLHRSLFALGIAGWLNQHNQYSSLEACEIVNSRNRLAAFPPVNPSSPVGKDRFRLAWRRFCPTPLLPLATWLYLVFVRHAYRDGAAGMRYALLRSVYECLVLLKVREQEEALRRARRRTAATVDSAPADAPTRHTLLVARTAGGGIAP